VLRVFPDAPSCFSPPLPSARCPKRVRIASYISGS
jgi:hypothetical protein